MKLHPNIARNAHKIDPNDIRTRNKDGLPYSLIFHHGVKHNTVMPPNDRFLTTNQLATMNAAEYGLKPGTLQYEKAKALQHEMRQISPKLSESHDASLRFTPLPMRKAFDREFDIVPPNEKSELDR